MPAILNLLVICKCPRPRLGRRLIWTRSGTRVEVVRLNEQNHSRVRFLFRIELKFTLKGIWNRHKGSSDLLGPVEALEGTRVLPEDYK